MNNDVYFANRDRVLKHFVNEAIKSGYWIYEPDSKMWYTPEEFLHKYSDRKLNLRDGWLDAFKIMNPLRGLDAADTIVQKINEKKAGFQKKILEYYQSKIK
ncbi:hypothetical protein [Pedobacter cryoconitis]|uniref:Uncharacterized protein n=1 Tax=Pedobacter cryoconitis TaxID=188932 RepID=A0A327S7W6_9SPHI|nr:hypothetical protein [Pedobacter cryoconitis]RAJ25011.1 hypothetical protein LY11_04198 [Pedobacter cryoconitis]